MIMRKKLGAIFHFVLLCHHTFSMLYTTVRLHDASSHPIIRDMERFQFRYFTTWNMIFQTLYLSVALACDFFDLLPESLSVKLRNQSTLFHKIEMAAKKYVRAVKGYMFSTFIFPYALFVFTVFWVVFCIDREWVLPSVADKVIPSWLNHCVHTNILLLLLSEMIIQPLDLPSFVPSFISMTILSVIYNALYFFTYFQEGKWLYLLSGSMSWTGRITFTVFNHLLTLAFYWIGVRTHNRIWYNKIHVDAGNGRCRIQNEEKIK